MAKQFDRNVLFKELRTRLFRGSLTQSQVDGMADMLDVWEATAYTDLRWISYIFAGVYHEVGGLMQPVREGFKTNDEAARQHVAMLLARGIIRYDYAVPSHGFSWFGRGRIQNTHYRNYDALEKRFGIPFTKNPSLLLESKADAQVTIHGHVEGIWTGKKLSDYFNTKTSDPVNARRIVNGLDKATLIAGYYRVFFEAFTIAAQAYQAAAVVEPVRLAEPIEATPVVPPAPTGPVWTPSDEPAPHQPNVVVTDVDTIKRVQRMLLDHGHPPGDIDGLMGKRTEDAISAFRRAKGLQVYQPDGKTPLGIDGTLLAELAKPPVVAEVPTARTLETKAEAVAKSEVVATTNSVERKTFWTTVVGAVSAAYAYGKDKVAEVLEFTRPIRNFFTDIPEWVWVVGAVGLAGYFYWEMRKATLIAAEARKRGELLDVKKE